MFKKNITYYFPEGKVEIIHINNYNYNCAITIPKTEQEYNTEIYLNEDTTLKDLDSILHNILLTKIKDS